MGTKTKSEYLGVKGTKNARSVPITFPAFPAGPTLKSPSGYTRMARRSTEVSRVAGTCYARHTSHFICMAAVIQFGPFCQPLATTLEPF
ncbi:hypothetical protein E2C01_074936 [Portunus trituberculatus]|uniref:Uncharacterized protein n=1 Tax=Portunus trituberculatus TaxID=210409 RepID=A0A5B7IHS6_PORTR|nr:hypothetical protein [Portunus trituberculatus]